MFNWIRLLVPLKGLSLFELDYTFGRSELNPSPKKVSDVGLLALTPALRLLEVNSDETSEATSDTSPSADTHLRVTPSSRPGEISYLINGSAGPLAFPAGCDLCIKDHLLISVYS